MTTDWRALCAELADALDHNRQCLLDDRSLTHPLADKARAALAQPEPEVVGPTDEELDAMERQCYIATEVCFDSGCEYVFEHRRFARAVLARWGRPAPAPAAPGEVAEVAAWLRAYCNEEFAPLSIDPDISWLTRAAELLERQAAPVPVPVSERLPGAGDCLGRPTEDSDAGWCWTYSGALEVWRFQSVVFPRPYPEPPRVILSPSVTHWLPHHALPLPSGEAE